MYPTGVNKYYDMYSFDGFVNYEISVLYYEFCDVIGGLFLYGIPLDFFIDWLFEGLSWDGFLDIIWYYLPYGDWVVWGWNVKAQDGWNLM